MKQPMRTLAAACGIALLTTACAVAGAQNGTDANARVFRLSIDAYRFVPDHVDVNVGETVRFVVTNPTDLAAFSTVDFDYHFSNGDEVMIGCHLPGHWAMGMKAAITVHTA
jgi:uncharacterized cupredoxin-like copper-binding protein